MFKIINHSILKSNLKLSSSVQKVLFSDIKRFLLTMDSPVYKVSLSLSKCSLEGIQDGRKERGRQREREKRIPLTPSPPQATHSPQLANKASYHSFLIPQLNSRTFHVPPQSSLSLLSYLSGSAGNSSTFLTSVHRRHSALRPYIWGQEQPAILLCMVRVWYVRPHTSGL